MDRLHIEQLDVGFKLDLLALMQDEKRKHPDCHFIDSRVWIGEGKGAVLENGQIKGVGEDYSGELNVRVLAGDTMRAPGYHGLTFSAGDFPRIFSLISEAIEIAYRRARASAHHKELRAHRKWEDLGDSLWSTELALPHYPTPLITSVPAQFRVDPRSVPLTMITALLGDASRAVAELPRIKYQVMWVTTALVREVIAGTRGACIDQTFAITEAPIYCIGQEGATQQEHYDVLAHQRGWEIMEEGVQEEFTRFLPFMTFARNFAEEISSLCAAPPCPTVRNATVVTEPHYNTLKVHEIVGHPTELDRILKMETGYAGRSWLFDSFDEHMVGRPVASPLVTAFSDPTLPGYGYYLYDHEGTPGRRVIHIDRGILVGFMSSAQTAEIFGGPSNGHWRAANGDKVPLIRMSNTVFAAGENNPEDIIAEVDHGYYLVGHAVPSIAESRENFRISARKVYEIRNGKIGQMFRDGGITADSKEYLMSVDAVGNDFRLYPVPNCGKGSPMQIKKLGNGGPTMRARATLIGPHEGASR